MLGVEEQINSSIVVSSHHNDLSVKRFFLKTQNKVALVCHLVL